jgi:hypothetical protein
MAKYDNQEYELAIRQRNEPGVLEIGLVFTGSDSALTLHVFKWPKYQNEYIMHTDTWWHNFWPKLESHYDKTECEYSPTGFCHGYSLVRQGQWKATEGLNDYMDLYHGVANVLIHGQVWFNNDEAQVILDACEWLWNTLAQREN